MKKGAIELSFSTIFSVFLIIFFIILGLYAISSFLNISDHIQNYTSKNKTDLLSEIKYNLNETS
ncbi:MAG: hypothetical protein AABX16_01525 [Nanoarchaeota archaeon]